MKKILSMMAVICVMFMQMQINTFAQGYLIKLLPTDDTSVIMNNLSTNQGTKGLIYIYNLSTFGQHRLGYMKFDLSGVRGKIVSAKLKMYIERINDSARTEIITAYRISDDTWTETTLPPTGYTDTTRYPIPLGTAINGFSCTNVPSGTGIQYPMEIDLTDYITSEYAGDKIASIALQESVRTAKQIQLYSKETTILQCVPYLEIDTCPVAVTETCYYSSLTDEGSTVTQLRDCSSELSCKVTYKNNSFNGLKPTLIAALYGANEQLLKVNYINTQENIPIGETASIKTGFTLPAIDSSCHVKVFLWDNISGMQPVTGGIDGLPFSK